MGDKLQAMAEEKGKSSFGFAYYLDTCKEERERGVTIQCNTKEFFTEKNHYTIVDALNDFIQPPKRHPELPVRLPISNIYNIKGVGQIICGTVEQGTLMPGDVIGIVPSGLRDKKIFSIEQHKKQLEKACPGDSIGLSIKGIGKDEKVS